MNEEGLPIPDGVYWDNGRYEKVVTEHVKRETG